MAVEDASGGQVIRVEAEGMPFWQVYTPPDGKRVCLEAMTSCSNCLANKTAVALGAGLTVCYRMTIAAS